MCGWFVQAALSWAKTASLHWSWYGGNCSQNYEEILSYRTETQVRLKFFLLFVITPTERDTVIHLTSDWADETADLWIFPPGVFWWNSITNDCESRLLVIPNLAQCFGRNVLARCSRSVALSWLLECSPLSHNESHPWENLCLVHAHIFVVFCIASAHACVCMFYKPYNLN